MGASYFGTPAKFSCKLSKLEEFFQDLRHSTADLGAA